MGCGCSLKIHKDCLVAYASATRLLKCPVCNGEFDLCAQKQCAPKLIATLHEDLLQMPMPAWGRKAKVLRRISQLHAVLKQLEKATETFMMAQREGYYGCVAFALAKATETADPNDILLAIHLATGVEEQHVLSDWARTLSISV